MKKFDLVKLTNNSEYKRQNLTVGMHGIVIEEGGVASDVMFFNPHNVGEFVIVNVRKSDLVVEKRNLPTDIQVELESNLDTLRKKAKDTLQPIKIKEYDMVELLVEDKKYSQYGVHKGDCGCVMDNNAVQDYIEVDFSGIDKNGNSYGDCISVKIGDLKVINK